MFGMLSLLFIACVSASVLLLQNTSETLCNDSEFEKPQFIKLNYLIHVFFFHMNFVSELFI